MQVVSVNNSYGQKPTPNFKSAYPVVHWVCEKGGSYAPALSEELNHKLQRTVVRILNNQGKNIKPEKLRLRDYVQRVISSGDRDYAQKPCARSFYNREGGWQNGQFEPFGYIITGDNAEHMNENLGKPIGRAKSGAPRLKEKFVSAEVNMAIGDYCKRGLVFVKKLASKFKGQDKIRQGLHTKFEVIRNKNGKIKEFRLVDLKFCPEEGAENPFVRTGYKTV